MGNVRDNDDSSEGSYHDHYHDHEFTYSNDGLSSHVPSSSSDELHSSSDEPSHSDDYSVDYPPVMMNQLDTTMMMMMNQLDTTMMIHVNPRNPWGPPLVTPPPPPWQPPLRRHTPQILPDHGPGGIPRLDPGSSGASSSTQPPPPPYPPPTSQPPPPPYPPPTSTVLPNQDSTVLTNQASTVLPNQDGSVLLTLASQAGSLIWAFMMYFWSMILYRIGISFSEC